MPAISLEPSQSPRRTFGFMLILLSLLVLSGCSSLKHKSDPNDVCYTQREQLVSSENYYTKSVLTGVAVGAVSGAALGAITGLATGQNVGVAAAIGAAGGAVAGGLGGYFMAKQKVSADAATLAGTIQNDILKENGEIDKASIAFARLRDCRFAAADHVRADFQAQRSTREQALKKLEELKTKFLEDIEIAETLGTKMGENMKEFENASEQLLAQNAHARVLLQIEKTRAMAPPAVASKCGGKKKCKKVPVVASAHAASAPCKKKKGCQAAPAPLAPPPAVAATVEVAKATESGQLKQKAFHDQYSNAKAEIPKAFALDVDGKVSLPLPEKMYCGL